MIVAVSVFGSVTATCYEGTSASSLSSDTVQSPTNTFVNVGFSVDQSSLCVQEFCYRRVLKLREKSVVVLT